MSTQRARPLETAVDVRTDQQNIGVYLTSDESSFVTGAALAVDGGRTFH